MSETEIIVNGTIWLLTAVGAFFLLRRKNKG